MARVCSAYASSNHQLHPSCMLQSYILFTSRPAPPPRPQEAADLLAVLLPPGCVLSVERDQKMLLRVSSPRDSTQQ